MRNRLRHRLAVASLLLLTAVATLGAQSDQPTLFRETLVQDIETAGFYELLNWLEVLGLSTRGDRSALAERLYDYYDVTEAERAAYERDPGQTETEDPPLVVDSASRTRYFTLEEIDERYIRLSGGVVVTLRDEEDGAVHRVSADEIVVNQERNTMAATGDVVYTLERDGTTEQFTGDALTVELDTWDAGFVDGVTTRERTIEGEQIDFRFAGTYITRSRDDVIVLEEGRITSSQADPPNYEIRATKIWVLAPGEWGLRNALLYVGRVPIFYLPFFFKPGDELFFNPALGTRDRSGSYIQTTTYIVGTPEEETSPFSILQIAEEQQPQSQREIDGLFLVPTEDPQRNAPRPETTVRLLADVYTKLGAYVALDAVVPDLGPLQTLELYTALAASRHIYLTDYPGAGTAYTPYYVSGGEALQSWNSSRVGRRIVPLRFAIDVSADAAVEQLSSSLTLEAYSDRRFQTDFADRAESIDWLGLLGQGEQTTPPSQITALLWQLDARYTAPTGEIERVSSLSVQRALVALNWRSREIGDDLLTEDILLADESPEAAFFYPQSLRLPEIQASVSGTLLRFPGEPERPDEETSDLEELIPPWERAGGEDGDDAASTDESTGTDAGGMSARGGGLDAGSPPPIPDLLLPGLQPALPSPTLPVPFRASLAYSVSPTVIVDQVYLDAAWQQPADVDFTIGYGGASTRVSGSLSYATGLWADLLRLDGSLATSSQYRTLFNRDPGYPDPELSQTARDAAWETLELQAWSFTSFATTNNLTLRFLPLRTTRLWSGSSLAYTLNVLLYQSIFDEVVNDEPRWRSETIEWDEDYIRQHQVQATAQLDVLDTQTLQLTAALPPRDPRYTGQLGLRASPVAVTVSGGVQQPRDDEDEEAEAEWVFDPLAATGTLAPWEEVSLTNALSYNIEDEELTFNRTSLTAGPLNASYEARTAEGYDFGGAGVGWEPDGDERFRPFSASLGLSLDSDFDPLWKNRVVLDLGSDLTWQTSLARFTETSLRFGFSGSLLVHRFMRLSLQTSSVNSQSYVYVGPLAEEVGRERRSLALDLLRSFNFFNRDDRVASGFDLESISLNAIHDLGDWDLTVRYSGAPELETASDGVQSYRWRGVLDVTLQWRAIRELSTSIRADEDDITFTADS